MLNQVLQGDCLELMRDIPDKSVDMILCDLPYGTTACKWDVIIPFEPLWEQYKRIIKPNAAIVLTASQPFTSQLVMSNPKWFKYEWIWEKEKGTMPMNAPFQPIKTFENILVFSKSAATFSRCSQMKYFPQMEKGTPYKGGIRTTGKMSFHTAPSRNYKDNDGTRYPKAILRFNTERGLHSTQKPVALFEYLIKTYTNEGDLVLDNCAGSGTTAIAALNTDRNYILMEKEEAYIKLINERISNHVIQRSLF